MKTKRIWTIKDLKKALKDGQPHDFAIALNGGVYSRKTITLLPDGRFQIFAHIDDTEMTVNYAKMRSRTNIVKAMRLRNFWTI